MSIGLEMPTLIKKAMLVRDDFIALRLQPNTIVEPQIMVITCEIDRAVRALASGDVVGILSAYESLKGYER